MTGDQSDIVYRLKAVLPAGWFADETPILDGLLSGFGWAWSWAYSLWSYTRQQTRIATASDVWLDIIANDFFGSMLTRRVGQDDDAFRLIIQTNLLREHGTRQAVEGALFDLTGRTPVIFEPSRTSDTGGYATYGLVYGAVGGWGSLALPFQCFVTAYRPSDSGIALVGGWRSPVGAYGSGAIEYASLAMVQGQVTDADITAAIANVLPVAAIAWTRISS
ncbi:MAG: hypothetical protein JSR21_00020 [Proteobacteria bacterium]|nr:hypothetical protein [Pseudomonadota bacterium]